MDEFFGHTVFDIKCCNCYNIGIFCDLNVILGSGMSEVKMLNYVEDRTQPSGFFYCWRENSTLWSTLLIRFEFRKCAVVSSA